MKSLLLLMLLALPLSGQTASEWEFRGDFWSERREHREAARSYEEAIARDRGRRTAIVPKLARQLLWSDQPARAVPWFELHLRDQPGDCAMRNDYGLALAWSDRPDEAGAQYDLVLRDCPGAGIPVLLRAALAARWADRPSRAEAFYREVLREGDAAAQAEARVGLAHVALMRGRNREALAAFGELEESAAAQAAAEGAAIASARLGDLDDVAERVTIAAQRGALSRDFRELEERLEVVDAFELRPQTHAFSDADGTRYADGLLSLSSGWWHRGRGGVTLGRSVLENDSMSLEANILALFAEHRVSRSLGFTASVRRSDYDTLDWSPLSGGVHAVWTPADALRVDAALARLLVTDNVGALENRLEGDFLSLGADIRVSAADTIVVAADATSWNAGNRRTRVFLGARHQFEGVPRLTIEWPTLLQWYDEPFAFGLFSPRRYVETGPGVNAYRRFRRVWNASAYVRTGVQREDSAGWRWLGISRLVLERDLRDRWSARATAAWSNSNVTGSSGFRRTSVSLELARRW